MAITTILRRSISSVLPVAVRTVQRNRHHSALSHDSLSHKPRPWPFASTFHFYSSSAEILSADDKLVRAIESKIKSIEESDDHEAKEGVPDGFPFEIQDYSGDVTVFLTREYEGEVITVVVPLLQLFAEGDDEDDYSDTPMIPLFGYVSKKNGTYLSFRCSVFVNEITIDSLFVKNSETSPVQNAYKGPDFKKMDENLRNALHKYLEIRGIKPSISSFLHEYKRNKNRKESLSWLNNVKKCVEAGLNSC